MGLDILVFYGSVRHHRQGIKAVKFVLNKLRERKHEVFLIDPKEYDLPLLDNMYKEYKTGEAPEVIEKLADRIRKADAFVIVSGEYNQSIPPALTNLMDYFLEEYFFRPSGIVCYSAGNFGGVRAAVQLRSFLAEIGTVTMPTHFPIPYVQDAFDDDGIPQDKAYDRRIKQFLDELEWYANAIKKEKEHNPVPY